jgi:hypothetical protein
MEVKTIAPKGKFLGANRRVARLVGGEYLVARQQFFVTTEKTRKSAPA